MNTGHVAPTKINKLFLREILLEKATNTGHVAHKKIKLFLREIHMDKATNTGHINHNQLVGGRQRW